MAVNDLIIFRKGTASQWTSVNPVLASGEPGYDLTNSLLKIGDGISSWTALSGIGSTSVSNGSSSSSSFVGVRGVISTTGNLSSFAVSGGYPVGYLDLFQDGVKLVSSLDFSATDGSNVTLSNSVPSGTVLEYLTMASGVSSGGGSLSGSVTIPGLGDSAYSSVSLLLHGEGSNSSTTITDNSTSPKTITVTGGAQISTAQSKFGSSSIYLPASSTITTPSSSDFAFGTGDFTVEFWWYVTTLPTSEARLVNFGGPANQFLNLTYGYESNTFTIVNESVAHVLNTSQSVSLNQWHHISYTRASNTLYLFFNGALLGSTNVGGVSTPNTSVTFSPGPGGSSYFDEIRITKGVARYTSAFSPPTSVFADASSLTLPVTVSGSSGSSSSSSSYDSRWDLFLPPAPTGLTVSAGNTQATVSWTAPTVLSQTPITDYVVQFSSNSGSTWTTFSDGTSTSTSTTVTGLSNGTSYTFRVAAVNGIGTSSYSSASSSVTPSNFQPSAVLLTTGTSYTVPSGASTMKAWVVGAGGSAGAFLGNAGAVAYKTWSVSPGDSVSYSLGANSTYYSRSNTTLTYNGTTISAQSGSGSDWNGSEAATYSGGDGGANGGLHGYPSGSGGSGGAVGGNSGPESCGRYTATDVSGLFAAVVLAGGSVTESCGATAAFGSGGTVNAMLNAGIGGGGAYYYAGQESTTGGPSAVILYFS